MRILVIGGYAPSLVNFRLDLLHSLVKRGHQVLATAPSISREISDQLRGIGVRTHSIPLSRASIGPLADYKYLRRLRQLINREQPDYVIAYTIKPVLYGSLAAKKLDVQHIGSMITGLGYAFARDTLVQRVLHPLVVRMLRSALKHNHVVVFQNGDDVDTFKKNRLIHEGCKIGVVNGSGVDTSRYPVQPLPAQTSFLMIARLLVDKGVREYAAAAKQVRKSHPECCFRLAGWLDKNPRCIPSKELKGWTRDGTIDYLGHLSSEQIKAALGQCSVYVLPSYREGTPRTNLEAMSTGRPIITTDVPGCRQTVIDGVNGLIVPPRDSAALAEAMRRFATKDVDVDSMAQESRRIAVEKYEVKRVNASIIEIMGL